MGKTTHLKDSRGTESPEEHWEQVYRNKRPTQVSWFQENPEASLKLIEQADLASRDPVIDVGAGASSLVGCLLDRGFTDLTVLDVSRAAIEASRERLGERAQAVEWVVGDVLEFRPSRPYALWHDRACFHFMTRPAQRRRYISALDQATRPGSSAIIATFALDGPLRCSGLDIVRYDATGLLETLGPRWRLECEINEQHHTPWDSIQSFRYFLLRRS